MKLFERISRAVFAALFAAAVFLALPRGSGEGEGAAKAQERAEAFETASIAAPRCAGEGVGARGLVEPPGGAHRIGAPSEGVAMRVEVRPGDRVSAGQPLFALDDRAARAEVALAAQSLALAEARAAALAADHRKAMAAARAAAAALEATRAAEADAEDLAGIAEQLGGGAALSGRERTHRRLAAARARADVAEAEAKAAEAAAARDMLDAGRGGAKALVAEAEVEEARARLRLAEAEAERLIVRSPGDGRVLAVAIRPGERIERGSAAPILFAADGPPHLRVEIDALDLPRFDRSAKAFARRLGDPGAVEAPLRLLRIEPMVSAKSLFADALNEPVDRRVATAIYALAEGAAQFGEMLEVRVAAGCAGGSEERVALEALR